MPKPAEFKLNDIVKTIKGAQFWGVIIAFDNDEQSPGCTVMAIAPGFEGIKHVYPLKQLDYAPEYHTTYDLKPTFVTMGVGDGSGREFIHGEHSTILRIRHYLDIANHAIRYVEDNWNNGHGPHIPGNDLFKAVINRKVGI